MSLLTDALDALIDSAKLLGGTEAKKIFGCYTQEDSRFRTAMYESISKHRRAIEAAVLEAQAGQEPAWWHARINNEWDSFTREKPPEDAYDEGTLYPLYTAPVVQPGMVLVPREPTEAMVKAVGVGGSGEYERIAYRAMIAAAEGKK